jgi:hypothetical protein
MTYLRNRLASIWTWAAALLLSLMACLLATTFFPTLSLDQQAIVSYETSPYNYCLVSSVSSSSNEAEFVYFKSQSSIYQEYGDGVFSSRILNPDIFMQEEGASSAFTLTGVLEGETTLRSHEIGLTRHLAANHDLHLGDTLYWPGLKDPTFTIAAIYEDCFGIFDLNYRGDYGFFVLGYQSEALTNEHSYASFVASYESQGFGPDIFLKSRYLSRLTSEAQSVTTQFVACSIPLLFAFSFLSALHRNVVTLPRYRLLGYRSKALASFVLVDKGIMYFPVLAMAGLFSFLMGYGLFCLRLELLSILAAFILDYLVSMAIAITRRS